MSEQASDETGAGEGGGSNGSGGAGSDGDGGVGGRSGVSVDPPAADRDAAERDPEELQAELELLAEENRRLREEYRRARRTRHRRTARGMAALGLVTLAGAAVFPAVRDVLLALSGVGLFAAVLLYSLTPERFVAASVGGRVVDAHASTGEQLVADLGLADERTYLPGGADARLYVPQKSGTDPPATEEIENPFVVDADHRGLALPATGAGLFRDFEGELAGAVADDPAPLADQLSDALVEGFELVDGARPDPEPGRLTVAVTGGAYGDVAAFDHPVASFLGVGVATAMDEPATVEVADGDDRADALVTVRWEADEDEDADGAAEAGGDEGETGTESGAADADES